MNISRFSSLFLQKIHFNFIRLASFKPFTSERAFIEKQICRDSKDVLMDPQLHSEEIHDILLKQAANSVIFEIKSEKKINSSNSARKIKKFFSNIGEIYHFSPLIRKKNTYIAQFKDKDSVSYILNRGKDGTIDNHMASISLGDEIALEFDEEEQVEKETEKELHKILDEQENMSDQIKIITNRIQLPSSEIRARYLILYILRQRLNNLLQNKKVNLFPFGSSLTGAGMIGSDMDIVMQTKEYRDFTTSKLPSTHHYLDSEEDERTELKSHSIRTLETTERLFIDHIPEAEDVTLVINSRVPVLNFKFSPLNLPVDMTVDAVHGLNIAQIINWYARFSDKVVPFLLIIRLWAEKKNQLSHGVAYHGLTPFMLQIIALTFLIRIGEIPKMRSFGGVKREFMISKRPIRIKRTPNDTNNKTTEQLVCDFFEYFTKYPLSGLKVNMRKGQFITHRVGSHFCIYNPFGMAKEGANMAQNCHADKVEEMTMKITKAHRILKLRRNKLSDRDWGLNALLSKD